MKKTIKIAALALVFSVAAFSCKKNVSDAELTTQSTTVVAAYPGTSVEVKEGVAHLSGTFASQEEKDAAIVVMVGRFFFRLFVFKIVWFFWLICWFSMI